MIFFFSIVFRRNVVDFGKTLILVKIESFILENIYKMVSS